MSYISTDTLARVLSAVQQISLRYSRIFIKGFLVIFLSILCYYYGGLKGWTPDNLLSATESEQAFFLNSHQIHEGNTVSFRHNGTQKLMGVSHNMEEELLKVRRRSLDRPSQQDVLDAAIVTGSDKSHFEEQKVAIASVQRYSPDKRIIFYDLGLKDAQKSEVQKWCNLDYRVFNYTKYPEYIKHLKNYAWKILITQEILQEHNAIIWMDSSIRVRCKGWLQQMALTAGHTGIAAPLTGFPSTYTYTDPGMYEYIATNITLSQLTPMYGGGFFIIVNTKDVFTGFLQWWVRCSLTLKCISPPRCKLNCRDVKDTFNNTWANCHRFDQSALNLILLHHFKGEIGKYTAFVCADIRGDGDSVRTCN